MGIYNLSSSHTGNSSFSTIYFFMASSKALNSFTPIAKYSNSFFSICFISTSINQNLQSSRPQILSFLFFFSGLGSGSSFSLKCDYAFVSLIIRWTWISASVVSFLLIPWFLGRKLIFFILIMAEYDLSRSVLVKWLIEYFYMVKSSWSLSWFSFVGEDERSVQFLFFIFFWNFFFIFSNRFFYSCLKIFFFASFLRTISAFLTIVITCSYRLEISVILIINILQLNANFPIPFYFEDWKYLLICQF